MLSVGSRPPFGVKCGWPWTLSHVFALVARVSERRRRARPRGREVANVKSAKSIRVRRGFGIPLHERQNVSDVTGGRRGKGVVRERLWAGVCLGLSLGGWDAKEGKQQSRCKNMRIIMGREKEFLSFPILEVVRQECTWQPPSLLQAETIMKIAFCRSVCSFSERQTTWWYNLPAAQSKAPTKSGAFKS